MIHPFIKTKLLVAIIIYPILCYILGLSDKWESVQWKFRLEKRQACKESVPVP